MNTVIETNRQLELLNWVKQHEVSELQRELIVSKYQNYSVEW